MKLIHAAFMEYRQVRTLVFLLPLALILMGCASRITAANLAQIKTGMTSEQVRTILGSPDDTKSQGAVGLTSTTYVYRKNASEVKIIFLNDRVMAVQSQVK